MAPSARSTGLLTLVVALPAVAGCDSTFDQNARAKLVATREIASRSSQVVLAESRRVRIDAVTLLRDRASTAVVVELTNTGRIPLTDVPVTVGVRRHGAPVVLNKAPELPWFQTHVPAIAAGARATWVFRSPPGRGSKRGDRPYATVGDPATPAISKASEIPILATSVAPDGPISSTEPSTLDSAATDAGLEEAVARTNVRVRNTSGVPQFGLQVYAVASDGDRITAAGHATIAALERDASQTVAVPLTGSPRGAIRVHATPTIFR